MNDTIVSIRSLVKRFKNGDEELTILDKLDLDIDPGSSTAICGQSGSGKSTLLNIIGGLDTATEGTIHVGPWKLEALPESELNTFRSKYTGFIFQFHYLLKDFTALENIMLPAHIAGVPKKVAMDRARELIEEVGLAERSTLCEKRHKTLVLVTHDEAIASRASRCLTLVRGAFNLEMERSQ